MLLFVFEFQNNKWIWYFEAVHGLLIHQSVYIDVLGTHTLGWNWLYACAWSSLSWTALSLQLLRSRALTPPPPTHPATLVAILSSSLSDFSKVVASLKSSTICLFLLWHNNNLRMRLIVDECTMLSLLSTFKQASTQCTWSYQLTMPVYEARIYCECSE